MSLILDALKKAENERNAGGPVPNISTEHSSMDEGNGHSLPWIWIGFAVFLIAALIFLIVYLFMSKNDAPTHSPQLGATAEAQHLTEPAAEPLRQASEQTIEAPTLKNRVIRPPNVDRAIEKSRQQSIAAKKELIQSQYNSTDKEKPSSSATNKTKTQDVEEIQKLYASAEPNKNMQNTSAPKSQKAGAASAKNSAQQADVNTEKLEAYSNVKLIKELPFSVQTEVPTMVYTEHVYDRAGSFIVINGKRLREGSNFESGIKVEKILEDGVLLKLKNYQFKMLALNSWLNY